MSLKLKTEFYCEIPKETLEKYFDILVGKVFKILPLAEEDRSSAKIYLDGLHRELRGLHNLFWIINKEPMFVSLLSIITWLTNNITDEERCTNEIVKKEVFDSITLCNALREQVRACADDAGDDLE